MAKKNKYITIALLVGFLYRLLLGLQGIDHTDLGDVNTFYQNIFTHPEAVTPYFNYYLEGLFGGVWYHFCGASGLIGFRFLEALTMTAAVFFVYKAFEHQLTNGKAAVFAILISFLFPSLITTFHFYTMTFFFLALAAWCYAKSLYGNQLLWTILTGMALGCCFFVRTANISLGLLILIPVIYAMATQQRQLAIRLASAMLGGIILVSIVMFSIMSILGHIPYFMTGLREALDILYFSDTPQSFWNLFLTYMKSFINIILQILAIVGLGALYIQSSRLASKWGDALRVFLIVASIVLIATSLPYLSAISLYTLLCTPIFYAITPKEDKLIAAFTVAGAYIFPMGSDIGIPGIYHWVGALLIIPSAVGSIHTSRIVRRGALICSLYIASVMLWKSLSAPYGEQNTRWQCTERIGDSMLNTFTTPEKADDYRHILPAIQKYTTDNKWVVLGNQASEIYYATETLPYLGNTQLKAFTGEALTERLNQHLTKYGTKPVIVLLNKEEFDSEETNEVQEKLKQWMSTHKYVIVQDDAYLTIYQAPLES